MKPKPRKATDRTVNVKRRTTKTKQPGKTGGGKYGTLRAELMRQRLELLTQAGLLAAENQDQIMSPDTTDQAQAEVDRNFVLRLKEREQRLLKKIDDAVARIDNGSFGICRGCGTEIPLTRLQARPVTDLCIECKTKQEQDEMIRGRA